MKNEIARIAALGLLAGALGAQTVSQETERLLENARSTYGAERWEHGALRDGFPFATLEIAGFRGGELRSVKGRLSRSFTPADAPEDAPPAFLVQGLVGDTTGAAHDQLLLWLGGLSSPRPAPADDERDLSLGEVGYFGASGAGPRAWSWVAFARGNVAVRLVALDPRATPGLDLGAIAERIDDGIEERAPLALGTAVPKPEIAKLAPAVAEVVAGESVRLDFTAVDPAGGTPHLQWSVAGTAQGYVEEREDGWYFFSTGPGEAEVTLEVTGSTGTFVERTVEVSVADD